MSLLMLPLLVLLVRAQQGEPLGAGPPISHPKPAGELLKLLMRDMLSEKKVSSSWGTPLSPGRAPMSLASLLFREELPLKERPTPVRPLPPAEKRQKDLSSYNWNSFGLRYGKRQAGLLAQRAAEANRNPN
ncbi:metastasis-suppressor KiSS-1-like [Acipenser ruthenus]|uniref:metastasis-suppressor KiSS-1-like n=1 Tax=Acipenser ruthenus TaxID=7906 RepID=UPI00145B747C|nr:metastasis-suppressor KiSS-1-like [Acipenser ruthenus]